MSNSTTRPAEGCVTVDQNWSTASAATGANTSTINGIRAFVFCLAVGYMTFGPFYRQALKGSSFVFRPWIMFSGAGRNLLEVEFRQRHPDGSETPLDRYSTLGYDGYHDAPVWVRNLYELPEPVRTGMCEACGDDADIRFYAHRVEGGETFANGAANICDNSSKSVPESNPDLADDLVSRKQVGYKQPASEVR